jgi:preprotein translocase subunit Sec63
MRTNLRDSEHGFVEVIGALLVVAIVIGLIFSVFFVRFKLSNEVVSGIVYNTTNDRAISGATCFSVRAGENTYVSQENQSSYCIPKNSPYKTVVNKAAADKRIKVEVQARKYFTVKAPWTVYPNVTVKEIK